MFERIKENEDRLNNIIMCIKKLEDSINSFNDNLENIELVNKYYGSKNWFKDREKYEKMKIKNINAGVLSEDAIWNMNEEIKDLILDMEKIINLYEKKIFK